MRVPESRQECRHKSLLFVQEELLLWRMWGEVWGEGGGWSRTHHPRALPGSSAGAAPAGGWSRTLFLSRCPGHPCCWQRWGCHRTNGNNHCTHPFFPFSTQTVTAAGAAARKLLWGWALQTAPGCWAHPETTWGVKRKPKKPPEGWKDNPKSMPWDPGLFARVLAHHPDTGKAATELCMTFPQGRKAPAGPGEGISAEIPAKSRSCSSMALLI